MKLKDTVGKPNISEFVGYKEACYNPNYEAKGLNNTPSPEQLIKLGQTAKRICDPVRRFAGVSLSFKMFRSPAVEKVMGRSGTSQHCKCEAADINGEGRIKNSKLFNFIKSNLTFDQLICEYPVNGEPGWVHVSVINGNNRMQILTCVKGKDGKPKYSEFKKGDCNE